MKDLGLINLYQLPTSEITNLGRRFAARAIVFDAEQKVALLHVSKHDYYKLPGGGIEAGEDPKTALLRECLEEIGCSVEVLREVGEISEYRELHQTSYCYLARVTGDKASPDFTDQEKEDGFEYLWVTLDEAINLTSTAETTDKNGIFIRERDTRFLQEAKRLLHLSA